MKKRILSVFVIVILTITMCSCGTEKKQTALTDIDLSGYPIKTDVTLKYWLSIHNNISAVSSSIGDTEFAKALEKNTGVKIEYIHPPVGQETEKFNLMMASGDFPDIIEYDWTTFSGGPDAAIKNNIIIPLDDLIKEYAPNLCAYLEKNPDVDKAIKSKDGHYYVFPFVRSDDKLLISSGPIVRDDWLEELGIEAPKTTEDWENMLIAFRDKKGAKAPLSIRSWDTTSLLSLVNASRAMYQENGKVKYGVFDEGFKEALQTLNRWYKEGLLDNNYSVVDTTRLDSNILNGETGATFHSGGSGLGKWIQSKAGDPNFSLSGISYPTEKDGTPNKFATVSLNYEGPYSAAISSSCKNPELAVKYLDYLYSEEGHNLVNFGVEGVSYEWIDGYPTYTELIMNNPEGLTSSQAMAQHFRSNMGGPFVQDVRYIEQYYSTPQQKDALEAWFSSVGESSKAKLPKLFFSSSESKEYTAIINDANKFNAENIAAFISGGRSFDEFDEYIADLKKLNIERAIEIAQNALNEYNK